MVALNSTLLGTGAATTQTLTITNVNPGGVGACLVIASRMSNGGEDATPTITDSVDGATGWVSIGLSRIPGASYNYAVRAWYKTGWTGNRSVLVSGNASIYSVQAICAHLTAYDTVTPIGGIWTTSADIGDGAETGTLNAAPPSDAITVGVVCCDSDMTSTTWGTGYALPAAGWFRAPSATGGGPFSAAVRGTGSTSTDVAITDTSVGHSAFFGAVGLGFVLRNAAAANMAPRGIRRRRSGLLVPINARRPA